MAKQFPENVFQGEQRVLDICKRPALAQVAMYQYSRGGQRVTGPSFDQLKQLHKSRNYHSNEANHNVPHKVFLPAWIFQQEKDNDEMKSGAWYWITRVDTQTIG